MHEIRIESPRVDGDRIELAWRVEPERALHQRTSFHLRVENAAQLPERVLWLLAMLALHPHWVLLRPCRIHLPIRLGAGEKEFWLRLLDATVATLEGNRGGDDFARSIEIVEDGAPLAEIAPLPDRGRCAVAFSGGKDSLLTTGLLSELVPSVLLVTTTSPMPPLYDHITERRRHVLRSIATRRANLRLLEVESDYRASWKNDFPPSVGYQVATNELVDTFLYLASLIAAAWTDGATHLFLASEAEVQENVEIDGRTVQHPHAMYSVATQDAVAALLARFGMRYGSLTSPLRSEQVQQLLWQRYPDLADLQYSCWRVGPNEATCSSCSQCLRIAFASLAIGESPSRMGIDLRKLIGTMRGWEPRTAPKSELPNERVAFELHAQTVRSIVGTPLWRVAKEMPLTARGLLGIVRFVRFRRRLARVPAAAAPGYRPAYLRHVDPLVRERLAAIYAASFGADRSDRIEVMRQRGEALASWIAEPLQESSAVEGVA
ncbi:MAG: hypothetical protein JOZ54_12510 [Acidobacteria bacterium]|nr:hypothetical protein [Acidobacteriota bacterium]